MQDGATFDRLVEKLLAATERIEGEQELRRAGDDAVREPSSHDTEWDPRAAAAAWAAAGDREEGTWLAFLTTYFGPDEYGHDRWAAVRAVYTRFGLGTLTWQGVQARPDEVRELCLRHHDQYITLRRGNHRKYEPRTADHPLGIGATIGSYVDLIRSVGGRQELLFAPREENPEERFERLMHDLRGVIRLGRTGRFDLLALLGNLGIYSIRPPRIYLGGATGPHRGARRLFDPPSGTRTRVLDERASDLARRLGVEIEAMEDALCNWQKT